MSEELKASWEEQATSWREQYNALRIELEEAQASTEFQGKIADELSKQLEDALRGSEENADWFDCLKMDYDIIKKQLEDSNKDLQETMHGFVLQREAFIELKPKYDVLRKQLEIAVEALKGIPHNVNHTKHGVCHGCEMDNALAEIEKVSNATENK